MVEFGKNFIKIKAKPITAENIIPMDVSGVILLLSAMGPIIPAVKLVQTKAPIKGFIPKIKLTKTPKKAAWLIHIPKKDTLRVTNKTPIKEQESPANIIAK